MNRENKKKSFEKNYYKTHPCNETFVCKVCGKTVDDFDDLLNVMNTPALTEFQYLVSGDEWTVTIR